MGEVGQKQHRPQTRQHQPKEHVASAPTQSRTGAAGSHLARRTPYWQRMLGDRAVQHLLPPVTPVAPVIEDELPARLAGVASGSSLAPDVQHDLESGLGADLSDVRVHTDAAADDLARAVDASAFTIGDDIFFRAEHYDPASPAGMHLLTHEVVHTVQQAGRSPGETAASDGLAIGDPSAPAERVADAVAAGMMAGRRVDPLSGESVPAHVQRKPVTAPLRFINNRSYVTFTPHGRAIRKGPDADYSLDATDFPDGYTGEVTISPGISDKVRVRLWMKVDITEALIVGSGMPVPAGSNEVFWVDWDVSVAPDGRLTIDPNGMPHTDGPKGSATLVSLASINPVSGPDYVQVAPLLQSAGGADTTTLGVDVLGIGGGTESTTNVPGRSVQQAFRLYIRPYEEVAPAKDPTGTVTFGKITAERKQEVIFDNPKTNRYRAWETLNGDQLLKLTRFYNDLNETTREQVRKGIIPIQIEVHASTTGTTDYNLGVAIRRLEYMKTRLRAIIGDGVRFEDSRAPGDIEAQTPDEFEDDRERRAVVTVWEQISEGESPAGASPAGSTPP